MTEATAQPDSVQPAPVEPAPITDRDAIELRDAEAAAQAEEAAAKGTGTETAAGTEKPSPPAGQKSSALFDTPTVPTGRFNEALAAKSKAEQEAAYWKGQAEARMSVAPAPGQQQPVAKSPELRLAEIPMEVEVLAKQFDDGEITMTDFKRLERRLAAEEQTIREDVLLNKVRPSGEKPPDLYLDEKTGELEGAHPWVGVFDAVGTKTDWNFLEQKARENLSERGIEIQGKGQVGSYQLRAEMAKLADELGPSMLSAKATAKGIALPGQSTEQPAQQQQAKPLSPKAQALEKKLGLAASAPPNLRAMTGAAGEHAGHVSASQIENMSDDEIAKLPPATLDRILLGVT